MKTVRTGLAVLVIALLMPCFLAAAAPQQQQNPSLGDVARRLRDQRKEQPKAKRVWDNDNIPQAGSEVSVVGQTPAPKAEGSESAAAKEGETPVAKGEGDQKLKEVAETQAALLDAKKNLETLQQEFDLVQRQNNLDSKQFYGKPGFSSDKEGQAKLDAESAQVDAKKLDVAAAQQKITELQQKLDELKAAPAVEKPEQPAPQPPSQP
jgi:hypothetical protein